MLASEPVRDVAERRRSQLASVAPAAGILGSDDFASLRPGYWVVYLGGYSTGDATVAECKRTGLALGSECYGRFLSFDPADEALIAPPRRDG